MTKCEECDAEISISSDALKEKFYMSNVEQVLVAKGSDGLISSPPKQLARIGDSES